MLQFIRVYEIISSLACNTVYEGNEMKIWKFKNNKLKTDVWHADPILGPNQQV